MANKILRSISILLAVGLVAAAGRVPASAQTTESSASDPMVQRRCTTVALVSENPSLPLRLIESYLQERGDFQASKLMLTDEPTSADATVTLTRSGERDTRVAVFSHISGRHVSAISLWTEYPGMIASDVMEQLRATCPGSVVARTEPQRAGTECRKPSAELRSVATIAGCSQTSWMDTRDIYKALKSRPELKQWSVQVTPACDGPDAVLDITHNLNVTVEWFWTLRARRGNTIFSGRVIAFNKRDAASKIAAALTREIALAHGADVQTATADSSPAEGYVAHVLLLPTDFSVPDTRTSLYIDGERVVARDINNRSIFDIRLENVLDARLRADWRRSFQLSDPTPLALRAAQNLVTVVDDAFPGATGEQPVQPRSWFCRFETRAWSTLLFGFGAALNGDGPVLSGTEPIPAFCPALDSNKFALSTAGLIGYVGAGTVLAQIPTRVEILEIAWEQDGLVKTVSLQVPPHESKRLLRALHPADSGQPQQACSSPIPVATSQQAQEDVSPSDGQDGVENRAAHESQSRGFKHFMERTGFYIDRCAAQAEEDVSPITDHGGTGSVTAQESHGRGFKHFMGRATFYAGQGLVCATVVAGYAAAGGAMAAN